MALQQMDKQQTLSPRAAASNSHQYKPSETVLSQTVIRHGMTPDNSADEGDEMRDSRHRREITEVFQYDTTTLNKEFQAEITSVFSVCSLMAYKNIQYIIFIIMDCIQYIAISR